MKSNMDDELSLDKIDDYNGNESKEKRNTVRLVIVGLIALGILYAFIKIAYNDVDDYVGTTQSPGISTSKN